MPTRTTVSPERHSSPRTYPTRRRLDPLHTATGSGGEELAGVTPVDVADERRVDVVAQQLLKSWSQALGDIGWHGEDVVLDRSQPCHRVVKDDAEAGLRGAVCAPSVPHAPQVDEGTPRRDLDGHGPPVRVRRLVHPAVAFGHDTGGAVGLDEVHQWPHDVYHQLRVRPGERVDGVVGM